MKLSILGRGLVMLGVLLGVLLWFEIAEPSSKLENGLRVKLRQICDQVNQFYRAEGFPMQIGSPDSCPLELRTDEFTKETYAVFDTHETPMIVNATMDAASGKLFWFYSYEVAHAHQRSPRFEIPPPAKLSEAQATEIATKFADIFIKPWNKKYLGKPKANFTYSEIGEDRQTGKWVRGGGEWDVSWEEQTPSGIPFFGNGVRVSISEQYGPYQFSLGSTLPEDEIANLKVISQDQALVAAQKGLEAAILQIRAEGKGYNDIGGMVVSRKASVIELRAERPPGPGGMFPSDLFLPTSLPKANFLGQPKARLVWWIKYFYLTANQYERGYIEVYIDAQDGSVLCCSYPEGLA